MIRTRIAEKYPHHIIAKYNHPIYVVDETNNRGSKKEVYIATSIGRYGGLYIDNAIDIGVTLHNNHSFVDSVGRALSQCECTVFPYVADDDSWLLFVELKYCKYKNKNVGHNLPKAKRQLLATHSYYKKEGIIGNKAISYLVVGFPDIPNLPFKNSIITPFEAQRLKRKERIIIGISNQCKVIDSKRIRII